MAGGDSNMYNVVFVLGGPGAGKGTQCKRIEETFQYVHLSAGDLLRAERKKEGSQVGELIEMHIKNGSIVPVQITCNLLKQAMEESGKKKFLIDGFPRNKDNLEGWNEVMQEVAKVVRVLFFDCPEQVCIDRCLSRGQTSGRTDDNEESLRKRIHTYESSTRPIINIFKEKGLVAEIQADKPEEDVFNAVRSVFSQLPS